jgi:hypothetical protein
MPDIKSPEPPTFLFADDGSAPHNARRGRGRGSKGEHARALQTIAGVPVPDCGPLFGRQSPLPPLWRN